MPAGMVVQQTAAGVPAHLMFPSWTVVDSTLSCLFVQATPSETEAEVDLQIHPGLAKEEAQQAAGAGGHQIVRQGREQERRDSGQRKGQCTGKKEGEGPAEYEFTAWEERVMEVSQLPGRSMCASQSHFCCN